MQGWRGMRKEIREILAQYAEEDYKDFSAGLIPGAKPLMGVRLPQLRQIARSIANDREDPQRWRRETESCEGAYEDVYFEETMLRGMLIGYGTARKAFPYEDGVLYLESFIPAIRDWSVCDSFCNSFTFANRNRDRLWEALQPYLYSDRMADISDSFPNRELSVWTRARYPYLGRILAVLDRPFHQGYYAQMAAAWLMAEAFVCFPYESSQMLADGCHMDSWTYNKALQKICESRNPDQDVKAYMKSLKK